MSASITRPTNPGEILAQPGVQTVIFPDAAVVQKINTPPPSPHLSRFSEARKSLHFHALTL